jgi:hypothetical protein
MPEIFQQFSGMAAAEQAMNNNSSDRQMYAEDHVRLSEALYSDAWQDAAGGDAVAAIHNEVTGTLNTADHQHKQAIGWGQCSADGQSTLATCRGIAGSM